MVRFIHAADLHLDSPFTGLKHLSPQWKERLQQAPYQALENLVHTAIDEQVDFVIIAGDIYDQNTRGFKAQFAFQKACQALAAAKIDVFLSYGNHDFSENPFLDVELPNNVYVFPKTVTTTFFKSQTGEKVALSGFSYPSSHIKEHMVSEFPARAAQADLHIGIYHGQMGTDHTGYAYAPFQIQEMQAKHYDYWALGHIHERQVLAENPPILYAGTTQGRHRLELGEKGVNRVELTSRGVQIEFIPTQAIKFAELTLHISESAPTFSTVQNKILEALKQEDAYTIYRVQLVVEHLENTEGLAPFHSSAVLKAMNEQLAENKQWLNGIEIKAAQEKITTDLLMNFNEEAWKKAKISALQSKNFWEIVSDLVEKHQIPQRDLHDEAHRKELLEKAYLKLTE